MKKLILIFFSIITISVNAQSHLVGIQSGLNMTNITADEIFIDEKFRFGCLFGLNYEFINSNKLSFGANLLYSQQGFKSQLQFTDANGNNLNKNSSVNFNYDYLAIPFKLGYSFGEKFKFTPRIGVCSSFLLSAKTGSPTIDNNGNQVGTEKVDVKKNVSKFDLSGLLELEAGYVFTSKMELFALLTCKRSFTTFSNENYFKDLNMKYYGFSIGFGLKYKINQ